MEYIQRYRVWYTNGFSCLHLLIKASFRFLRKQDFILEEKCHLRGNTEMWSDSGILRCRRLYLSLVYRSLFAVAVAADGVLVAPVAVALPRYSLLFSLHLSIAASPEFTPTFYKALGLIKFGYCQRVHFVPDIKPSRFSGSKFGLSDKPISL